MLCVPSVRTGSVRLAGSPGPWVRAASRVWARGVLFGAGAVLGIRHSEPYAHDSFPNDQSRAPDAIPFSTT